MTAKPDDSALDEIQSAGCRIASIRINDREAPDLAAELCAWEAASDEDFETFESVS